MTVCECIIVGSPVAPTNQAAVFYDGFKGHIRQLLCSMADLETLSDTDALAVVSDEAEAKLCSTAEQDDSNGRHQHKTVYAV